VSSLEARRKIDVLLSEFTVVVGAEIRLPGLLAGPLGRLKINAAFDTFILPFLGLIFLPWTTPMYAIVFPVVGFDWL
jgi:hypothetical protein